MVFMPTSVMTPHNVWECGCEDCVQWRKDTEKIRIRAFERCKLADCLREYVDSVTKCIEQ